MTRTDFTHILQYPEALVSEQARDLKSIIEEFPYFQPARALYLKTLKTNQSFKYNQELKTTAAYTTDRSILFDFITSEAFVQNEISQFIKQNSTHLKHINVDVDDISVTSKTPDNLFNKNTNVTEDEINTEFIQPKITPAKLFHFTEDPSEALKNTPEEDNINKKGIGTKKTSHTDMAPETILEIGKPLDFNATETHSFNEWLKLTSFDQIDRSISAPKEELKSESENIGPKPEEKTVATPSPEQAKKFALIDKFISSNPKIDPKRSSGVSQNLAESHMLQPESLMTETLARIYVEQKNYKKAIQSYNILSLKYPEKSGFFADRIKAVKQIQEQNKKN
ncbi:hypothetical protein [uncultured Formosa sp.]|uniref:hypothetical protein n=1 Tax=uncultured Formosa sp. TaxID=255435 RepID=UPI00262326BE|nr:hypothetical protein [uncultured Formosa sp.]